jgi:hypothetical protein
MTKIRFILLCLPLAFSFSAVAQSTNSIVWQTASDCVSADVHSEPLWPLLEDIAHQTGWHIFVEPDTERSASTKFKDLPSTDALKMLLGNLNFALVPLTNAPMRLYIFRTTMQNATKPVLAAKALPRRVANELLLRVKPGTDIEALAKSLGAKITGRLDKLGLYKLQFADAAATDAALAQLKGNGGVANVDYNYYFDPPPQTQPVSAANLPPSLAAPLSLQLNPPGASGKVIVGLIDMNVQSLGAQLDKFILPQLSVAGDEPASTDITHGTAMAYTILEAISQVSGGATSVQIQPVDVYGGNTSTTSWNVALGIQAAVDSGANVLNLSLGSAGDSSVLDSIIKLALADNIMIFGAAGNTPVGTPTYPAAIPGVVDVTALSQPGQLANYANYWSGDNLALPGSSVVYFGNQAWLVQGTSTSTANATGVFAGSASSTASSPAQILAAMQKKFAVPAK